MQMPVLIVDETGSRLAQVVWEAMRLKCQHLVTHVKASLLSRPYISDHPALYLIVSYIASLVELLLICLLHKASPVCLLAGALAVSASVSISATLCPG